jgi:hypothetical protein
MLSIDINAHAHAMEVLAQQIPEVVLDESLRIVKRVHPPPGNVELCLLAGLLRSFPLLQAIFVMLRCSHFFICFQRLNCQFYCQIREKLKWYETTLWPLL